MDQNLTDDRTTVGSHDDRSSGGVFLMPSERRMREAVSIQPHARTLACAKPVGRLSFIMKLSRSSFALHAAAAAAAQMASIVGWSDSLKVEPIRSEMERREIITGLKARMCDRELPWGDLRRTNRL